MSAEWPLHNKEDRVKYANLRERPIEELLNDVQALASMATQSEVQSIAALGARLTVELSGCIQELSGNLVIAKKQLVERLDTLTTEIAKSSTESSAHTSALVRWTIVLVVVTGIYTLITGGLLVVAVFR